MKFRNRKPKTRVRKTSRKRSLRFRAINIIRPDNRRADAIVHENKDKTINQLLESVLPYMAVGEYSLTVDKAPVFNAGPDKEVYNLDVQTMSLTRVLEGYPKPEMSEKDTNQSLFSEPRYIELNGVNLPLSTAFMFTYTKIFEFFVPNREMVNVLVHTYGFKEYDAIRALKEVNNASVESALERLKTPLNDVEVNWFDSNYLGLSSNDQRMIKELMNTVNDPPLSTITNLLHLFIFINRMPLFFRCIQATNKQGIADILKEEFSDEVLASLYELRSLGYDTHPSAIRNSIVSSKTSSILPILCSTERTNPPLFDSFECPSSSKPAKDRLIESIDKYGKFIRRLNGKQDNLGYILFLNYWMYRTARMPIINDRFPLNISQQLESLKSMTSNKPKFDDPNTLSVSSKLISRNSIEFIESQGEYRGNRYPNCVEKSVFKLIQLMLYDPDTNKLNVSHWTSMDEGLKRIVFDINAGTPVNWNLIVCGRRNIDYNEGQYNIKSNVKNVLELLNQLSGNTTYRTLQEWVNRVYTNPRSLPLEVTSSTIQLDNYLFEIMQGHSSFSSTVDNKTESITFVITDDLLPIYSIFKLEKMNFDFKVTELSDFKSFKRAVPTYYLFNDDLIIRLGSIKPFPKDIVTGIFAERGIHPHNVYIEYLKFDLPLHKGLIPEGVVNITIFDNYNLPIGADVLPLSLQSLTFGRYYNLPIGADVLPLSLQSLEFGFNFNQLIDRGVLPSSLQSLTFGVDYNKPIETDVLPSSLKTLKFGYSFNQPIGVGILPSSLQSLSFGYHYYQPIGIGVLPTSLQTLTLGANYDRPVGVGVLPSSLKSLTFGDAYNQTIGIGVLPTSLQTLIFGVYYNKPIGVGVLPLSLKSLTFGVYYDQPIGVSVLPSSLHSLTFSDDYNQPIGIGVLPLSLKSLTLGDAYNQPISAGVLPLSLKSLTLGDAYNQPISAGVLPSSLQSLTFGRGFNQPIDSGVLPSSLQSLMFGYAYNQPIGIGVLPSSLQSLMFGYAYNQPIGIGVLPLSLKSLTLGDAYNQIIGNGVLPTSLQALIFGAYYNKPIGVGVLPLSLKSLTFGVYYDQPIDPSVPPASLQSLKFDNEE